MSFLRKLFGLDAGSHVSRGDAFAAEEEWGLAHLEYEKAKASAEGPDERGKAEEKLRLSAEKLYERNLVRAGAADENGDLAEALAFCQGALEVLPPGDERRVLLEARIETLERRIDEANLREEIETYLDNENPPDLARQRRHWFLPYLDSGSDEATERQYTNMELIELAGAVDDDPSDPNRLVNLGMALAQAGLAKKAIASLRRAADLRPDDKEVRYFLGNLYADEGDLDLAVTELEKAIELDPSFALAYLYLARTYLKVEDDEAAEPLLKKALEVASEDSGVPEEAAELLAQIDGRRTQSDDPEKAPESLDERIP